MKTSWCRIAVLLAALCAVSAVASADSARALVNQGNAAYAAEQYDEALSAYEKASAKLPESARLSFNRGAAHYMKGDYQKARTAFEDAAAKSPSIDLESRSMYNLGNCAFREAERLRDSDPTGALERCGESVRHYQQALQLDPDFKEAGENLEIVRRVMKTIQDAIDRQNQGQEQKQQPDPQQDPQQDQQAESSGQDPTDKDKEQQQQQQAAGDPESDGEESDGTDATDDDQQPTEPPSDPAETGHDEAPDEAPEQSMTPLNEEALDILAEEEANKERRRLPVRGGYRDVEKNW